MSDIAFRQVKKTYGKNQVVHGVDLKVNKGEFVVILGPSGCGKSTLLRMVAGLEAISSGDIAIGGKVVNRLEPRARGCAMVFQNYALYPHMTVSQNIGYALKVAGLSKRERQARVADVAEALGLGEFLDRKPAQLSGGQRQRVAMGRAMIREPQVFLYDEPLSNIDAKLRVAMRIEIRKLHQKLGTTTLFVTHDQIEAMTLADRIVVMNKGVVEQVGTPFEVYHQPMSTYVASFIGAPGMNLLSGHIDPQAGTFMLADGQSLALDKDEWINLPAGEAIAGVRAENIRVRQDGTGLRAKVQFSEELGASCLVHTELNGAAAVAASQEATRYEPGAAVVLEVNPAAIHLFDVGTGLALQKVSRGKHSDHQNPGALAAA